MKHLVFQILQVMINFIKCFACQDIRSQRHYRQTRRQEMTRLANTLKALNAKRAFFEQQIDFYSQYVKTCIDNLSAKGGRYEL